MLHLSCRGTVRGKTSADSVVERQRAQCDNVAGTRTAVRAIAGRLAVGRRPQAAVAGENAPLPTSIKDRMNGNDMAGLENAHLVGRVMHLDDVAARVLFGTL
jgi:hypothetical protein